MFNLYYLELIQYDCKIDGTKAALAITLKLLSKRFNSIFNNVEINKAFEIGFFCPLV